MKAILSAFDRTGIRGILTPSLSDQDFVRMITSKSYRSRPPEAAIGHHWQDQVLPVLQNLKKSSAKSDLMLGPPGLFTATAQGLKVLADLSDLGAKYPTSSFFVMRPYLSENRASFKKFLMALIEGLHIYVNDKEFSMRVMQKYTKLGDREIASKTHDYYGKKTLLVPLTDTESVKNAMPADKGLGHKPEEFYDNSIIQELVKEGFAESLKKKVK